SGVVLVYTVEAADTSRQVFRGNAWAVIAYIELNRVLLIASTDIDSSAGARVLDGVVDEIGEHLMDGIFIGEHFACCVVLGSKFNSGRSPCIAKRPCSLCQKRRWCDRLHAERSLAGFNASQNQQIFRETRHTSGILPDDFQEVALRCRIGIARGLHIEQSFGESLNRGKRRSQFMRIGGTEIATRLSSAH